MNREHRGVTDARQAATADQDEFDLVHASPGRIRLRARGRDRDTRPLEEAAQRLSTLQGIHTKVVPDARSIVITFDPNERTVDDVLAAIQRDGVRFGRADEQAPRPRGERSELGDWIAHQFENRDRRMYELSGGVADLRTVVPVALALLAARELLVRPRPAPPWWSLLWYAFSAFARSRTPRAGE